MRSYKFKTKAMMGWRHLLLCEMSHLSLLQIIAYWNILLFLFQLGVSRWQNHDIVTDEVGIFESMVEPCNEFTWILVMESTWQRLWLWCGRWGETLSSENWRAFPTVCLSFLLCQGKWAVSIMFLGTRCPKGSTSHLPPYTHHENSTLIDNWLQDGRPFSHLLFHDQSYLKIKSRIRRYFSDSSNLEQCWHIMGT